MAENIETRVGNLETKAAVHDEKFDAFIREMQDFKQEVRQQNEMRANEISVLRQKHDEDMQAMRTDMQSIAREVRNLFLTAAIGIGAMFLTVVYTIIRGG